ncbi:MAG: hypothetical protein JXB23_18470 [Candidatus Aminicenantes bacterium]|nr:hypothetical protein [Candidatus Aminicenantes bacterium]
MTVFGNYIKSIEDKPEVSPPDDNGNKFTESMAMNSAKILLLDFEAENQKYFEDRSYPVSLKKTNWKSNSIESIIIPEECSVILYQADSNSPISSAHARDADKFKALVEKGGSVVCFIGDCQSFHLTNFSGIIPKFKLDDYETANIFTSIKEEPFASIFDTFGGSIKRAKKLITEAMAVGTKIDLKTWDPKADGEMQVLAASSDGYPISFAIRHGKGYFLFLPWFGENNTKVAEMILNEKFPKIETQETAGKVTAWLEKEEYSFPGLHDLFKEKEEARKKYEQALAKIDKKIEEIKEKQQTPFQQMLITDGRHLKKSLITALEFIGWKKVVDVDQYWKNVVRNKEEDIWLLENESGPIETLIKTDSVFLVNVVGSDKEASDEDCAVLQKFKGRRMQEFDNTKMKAILIGNYFKNEEAGFRKNPFNEVQIADAEKDANGLITTYELFKAVKAVMEDKIKKEEIQKQMKEQQGLIKFSLP